MTLKYPRLLGIVGSPRKNGATDHLVKKALEGARQIIPRTRTEILYLNELKINPCQACGSCKTKGKCVQNDEMKPAYSKFENAEGIVLGSPIYMGYVSAQTKLLIDRMYAYIDKNHESSFPPGKKMVFIITQGGPDTKYYLPVIKPLERFFIRLGIKIIKTIIASPRYELGDNHIDLVDRPRQDLLRSAFMAGQSLAKNLRN